MHAPQVFVSMIGALIIFAIGTYILSGSISATLLQTVICAVLLQVGYFGAMLFLVWKEARTRQQKQDGSALLTDSIGDDKQVTSLHLPRLKKPGHFNS